jgi:hypothetical protein
MVLSAEKKILVTENNVRLDSDGGNHVLNMTMDVDLGSGIWS